MANRPLDERKRRQAEWLLRKGLMAPYEIAAGLKISRQILLHWAKMAKIDYKRRRQVFLRRCFADARRAIEAKNGLPKDKGR